MRMITLSALAIAAFAALPGCNQSNNPSNAASAASADGKQLVYEVDSVILQQSASGPGMTIKASGTVRSAGWTAAELRADPKTSTGDMAAYKFVAMPPPKDKIVTQAEMAIEATLKLDKLPPNIKSVRVEAETNRTDSTLATAGSQHAQTPANQSAPGTAPAPAPFAADGKKT